MEGATRPWLAFSPLLFGQWMGHDVACHWSSNESGDPGVNRRWNGVF